MFFSLEKTKNKSKSTDEAIPLTRSQSLQHQHRNGGGGSGRGRHPIVVHSPPLVLHTPECKRRNAHLYNENRIAILQDSPGQKRSFAPQNDNNSVDRDQRDGHLAVIRKTNGRRTSCGTTTSDTGSQQLRTEKRASFQINYRRRQHKSPAPVDDARKPVKHKNIENSTNGNTPRSSRTMSLGMLDSSRNSDGDDEPQKKKEILVYFSQLSKARDPNTRIDIKKLQMLLSNGADINATDKYGQFVMHEIARNWHPDVARYLIKKGAELDQGDKYGRTPLHLAAAVGHTEMIEFLVQNKARINARTPEEKQTPIHYAAKNNAVESLKVLVKCGANVNDRDYRSRTPLYLAAENGRVEAALYLLKLRAPAAVYDIEGVSCLSIMVQRMPYVAGIALKQFYIEDPSNQKLYCYLNYLENKLTPEEEQKISWKYLAKYERDKEKREMSLVAMVSVKEIKKGDLVKSVLEKIVEHNEVRIAVHPAIKLLIEKKWNLCGRMSAFFGLFINIFFALVWSAIGIATPITGVDIYRPFSAWWHIIVLEVLGVGMTLYFMVTHIMEDQIIKRRHNAYRVWSVVRAERDLKFCHPRWPEEKRHIHECVENANGKKRSRYFSNGWNCFDWFVYALIFVVMTTRILNLILDEPKLKYYHIRIFSIAQIFVWLRVLRRLRPFPTFGPFIIMLGYVVRDTLRFLVLFLMFFIPYCCAFWIIFRDRAAMKSSKTPESYLEHIHDLVHLVWQITVIGEFEWEKLNEKDRVMAQILTGTYMAIVSVVCISLYIALLTNTFSRVYPQAKARALLIQAAKILFAERSMSKKRKLNMKTHIHEDCAPFIEHLQPPKIAIATNATTLGKEDFLKWRNVYENETDNVKASINKLHAKQEHLLSHFKLILQNIDDQDDLVEEI